MVHLEYPRPGVDHASCAGVGVGRGAGGAASLVSVSCVALYTVRIVVVGNRPPGARGDPRPAAPPAVRRRGPQPVRKYNCLSTSLQHMRPSHGAMGLRWRMAMRCYVIATVRLSRARLEHPSIWSARARDARVRRSGCFPVPRRVAVSKLVSKHRLSYYCDIYAPDVPVDGMFSVRR